MIMKRKHATVKFAIHESNQCYRGYLTLLKNNVAEFLSNALKLQQWNAFKSMIVSNNIKGLWKARPTFEILETQTEIDLTYQAM